MKFSNSFKIIFGFLFILLIAVISSVYHIDFTKFINNVNDSLTNDSSTTKKIKVSLVNCIDGDTARFNEEGNVYTYRFLGINTPEVKDNPEEYGVEASNYTCNKLKNADINTTKNKNATRQNLLTINNWTIISRSDYTYVITVNIDKQHGLIIINYGDNNSDNILLFKTHNKDLVCENFTVYYIYKDNNPDNVYKDNNPDNVSKMKKLKNKILIYKDVLKVRDGINCIEKQGINAENKYIEENFEENFIDTYIFAVVKKDNIQYFIYADNINSIKKERHIYGLFKGSKATEIEILSCGNNIKNMSSMFENCSSLTSIKFPDNFNTSSVTNMSFMFYQCSKLTELDLSSFNTENVTDMSNMFAWCKNLIILKLGINFKIIFDSGKDIVLSTDTQEGLQRTSISLKKTFDDMFFQCFQNEFRLICDVDFIHAHRAFCKSVGKDVNMLVNEDNVVLLPQKNNLLYLFVLNADKKIVDCKEYKEYDEYAK